MKKVRCVRTRRVCDLMQQQGLEVDWLIDQTGLEERVILAIFNQRYTPSPQQRAKVARALHARREEIWWGHAAPVEKLQDPI